MIVVDASALVTLLQGSEPVAEALRSVLRMSVGDLNSPELIDLEVAGAVRGMMMRRELSADRALEVLHDLRESPMERWSHRSLIERVWELRHNLTPYDAAYLALAERLGATLLTLDSGLATVAARTVEVTTFD